MSIRPLESLPGPRVAIIGGGIAGLAAAHRLHETAPSLSVTLFEAAERLGGALRTEQQAGYLLELGADNFITNVPWGVELCRRLGLADQLLPTRESQRRAMVVHRRKLVPVPAGFHLLSPTRMWPILRSPLLSWRGKLRVLAERFVPAANGTDDESLASFARRRLGREAFERLVQPLVAGIYTADAEKLSMRAALPRFVEMERQHGGLIRAARRAAVSDSADESGARYGMFVAPRGGMSSIVDALAARLPAETVRLGSAVEEIAPAAEGSWNLLVGGKAERFDAVVLAAPARAAAALLAGFDTQLAEDLRKIEYAGSAIVLLGYRRDQIAHPLDSFGFVVPAIERRGILAASFSSVKFEGRAPSDRVLIRVFLGGAERPEQMALDDDALRQMAIDELAELIGTTGEPELTRVVRWPNSMPQYHVGHVRLVERIESRATRCPTLALAGNAYHGVGVPHCIHSGERAAERIAKSLGSSIIPYGVQAP
ncbi:MAG TPA: protoporphyrinogen oxidase [Pirellulales bacterium]|nr:protoporphyrinogen oxidase [Pirellulales bacterium]